MISNIKFPPLGARIVKSAVAVCLCFFIYYLFRKDGIVFYSQLACLWCMQPLKEGARGKAIQRAEGTIVGALTGLIVLLISQNLQVTRIPYDIWYMLLVSLFIVITLYVTVVLNMKDASYFSCVVFLSIVVNHIGDADPYVFAWNRFLDTMIGIAVGMGVNGFHLPYQRNKNTLFISGLDDTLLMKGEKMSPYSQVELNRMLEEGVLFSVSTRRTPASLIEALPNIHLTLPVIAMDGAVLYDIKKNEYLKAYVISGEYVEKLRDFFERRNVNYFINMLIDNTLIIQYRELINAAEKDIYEKLHVSPLRNYTRENVQPLARCVYLMLIDKTALVETLADELRKLDFAEHIRIEHYPSDDYPGYSYIKIYNRNASRTNMMEYLKQMTDATEVVTFGSIEGKYDVTVKGRHPNQVVKTLKALYTGRNHSLFFR